MTLIDDIASALGDRIDRNGKVSLALSGGSSPALLYQGLSACDLDFARVTVTLIDDRLVPSGHDDSNQKLIREMFLKDRAMAAQFIPLQDWPADQVPDIGILGMGVDGHFASLFPSMIDDGAAFDAEADPAIITTAPMGKPLHPRITMNLPMILAIPCRVLMVIGEEKKAVLHEALNGADLPVARLLAHGGTRITHERI